MSQTQTQVNFTCPANKACFLNFAFLWTNFIYLIDYTALVKNIAQALNTNIMCQFHVLL